MTRPLRIQYPGALYHVTARGDRRESIYADTRDREIWLNTLAQVCRRYEWRCFAWCQMNNHYHFVVETEHANLSVGMRFLNGVYTQAYNYRHDLTGHVFQGRYHSTLVDKDSYFLEVCRYVVLNPVRAKLVSNAAQWRWSSHRSVLGIAPAPRWLDTEHLLKSFAKRKNLALAKYQEFIGQGCEAPVPWTRLSEVAVLGKDDFIESVRQRVGQVRAGQMSEVSRAQRKGVNRSLDWYISNIDDKQEAMVQAFESGVFTMKEIAIRFGVHYTTVSRAVASARSNGRCPKT